MEIETRYDPQAIEPRWLDTWEARGYFHAEPDDTRRGEPYCIVIPPPNVTGVLHLGHALNNTYQDVLVRWRRMQGRNALWMPGTDHAGIATQNVVERTLRKEEGKTRHDLGRERFLERVWAWKERNGSTIIRQLKRLGCSCDWARTRFTMDEGLSRAVLEVFIRLHEKGLVYRGEFLVNWCPRCETALSDEESVPHETEGGLYRIRYPIEGEPGRFITVATTRPETMLGDTGVAVHPDDVRYRDIVGKKAVLPFIGREMPIVADTYIDMTFGTGALKVTPGHDPNDFALGRRHGLPIVDIFTPDARVNENGGPFAGLDRFEARKRVLAELEAQGLLEGQEKHRHNVPRCQRCDTVLEPRLSTQWFVKMKPLADPAVAVVKEGKVRFTPERWKPYYVNWMEQIHDWCISRQLWWGHRIPAWFCEACDAASLHVERDGTKRFGRDATPIVARERPARCPRCGADGATALAQDPDVLDTWFSSWLWPFSTLGWPEKTRPLEVFYPGHVLVTAPEIIFFWVARMIMAGLEFMGDIPFSDAIVHGTVRDETGRKMSKSLGNTIDPLEIMGEQSADALRFTLMFVTPDGADPKINRESFELGRNFGTKLWNASRLVLANLDGYALEKDGAPPAPERPEAPEDRWILSRLHATIRALAGALEGLEIGAGAKTLYDFTWGDFCDWYLEMAKPRFRGESGDASKQAAQQVSAHVLDRLLRLLHPYIPFVTEELWSKLKQAVQARGLEESLAIAPFPSADGARIDAAVEARFDLLTALVRDIRAIRANFNIPPQKPLAAVVTTGRSGGGNGAGAPGAEGDGSLGAVRAHQDLIVRLARLEGLEVGAGLAKPHASAVAVVRDLEVFVPLEGLIDVEAEKSRLRGRLEKIEKQLAGARKKLEAPGFAEKAPADVVAKARESVDELSRQVASVRSNLRDLD